MKRNPSDLCIVALLFVLTFLTPSLCVAQQSKTGSAPESSASQNEPAFSDEEMKELIAGIEKLEKEIAAEIKYASFLEAADKGELQAYGITSVCKSYIAKRDYWYARMQAIIAANNKARGWAQCGLDKLPAQISTAIAMALGAGGVFNLTAVIAVAKAYWVTRALCWGAYGTYFTMVMTDFAVSIATYYYYDAMVKKNRC